MVTHIRFLKILFASTLLCINVQAKEIELSIMELTTIAQKIYQNECASNFDYLVHWNEGEAFASMGIGHFIWYPEGVEKKFDESFPALLAYMREHGAILPQWLEENKVNPWKNKQAMQKDPRAKSLREFLQQTISLQALFMAKRVNEGLSRILGATPKNRHDKITRMFEAVANSDEGYYPLIDYVNFKGEGIKASERYEGQGWGLLQVLECMHESQNPKAEFAKCAKSTLEIRVKNAPKNRNEQRWLTGWIKRIDTYLQP